MPVFCVLCDEPDGVVRLAWFGASLCHADAFGGAPRTGRRVHDRVV